MSVSRELQRLAELYDLQLYYEDDRGQRQFASEPALFHMVKSLGAEVHTARDIEHAVKARELESYRAVCEPVIVAQAGSPPSLKLRLPEARVNERYQLHVKLECGDELSVEGLLADLPLRKQHEVAGLSFLEKELNLVSELPRGYHDANLNFGASSVSVRILCPPRALYHPTFRTWGVFAPTYALYREQGLGAGDFRDLESLLDWVSSLGGSVVGTLPLLATFLDEPFDPSPYAPASRLFWNEFYLDLDRIVSDEPTFSANALLESPRFEREKNALRERPLVDYRRQMALKRQALELLAQQFFGTGGHERPDFKDFLRAQPRVRDYAEFRAATELSRKPWSSWDDPARTGTLDASSFRAADADYHLYVQWQAFRQMKALCGKLPGDHAGLYLDLPLGVHGAGYDVWRERAAFLMGCSLGAPPDRVFINAQHWGITPLHPIGMREQKYQYFIDCIRHHMSHASVLRIDHVMGLHRVYCIPDGMPAREGVFMRYRPEELYAVLALESTRNKTLVVGEDLGTVPEQVRTTMRQVGMSRMHVLQYELDPHRDPLADVPADVVASLNTHDVVPFNGYWVGADIEAREQSGLLSSAQAETARQARARARATLTAGLSSRKRLDPKHRGNPDDPDSSQPLAVLSALLLDYAASPAEILLVTLEDLWLETEPQNVPGTGHERSNWRRKLRFSLDAVRRMRLVQQLLEQIDNERRRAT